MMKKIIIIALIFVAIAVIYLATPIPQGNSSIQIQEACIDAFISYEQDFYILNKKNLITNQAKINRLDDDYFQLKRESRINLILRFEHSAYHLNSTLIKLQKKYPFLKNQIYHFKKWQRNVEAQVLKGGYVPYFQSELLFTQLQLVTLINNKSSSANFTIKHRLPGFEKQVKNLTTYQQCVILNQFGTTESDKLLSEQVAILASNPPQCNKKEAVGNE